MTAAKAGEWLETQKPEHVLDLIADELSEELVPFLLHAMREKGKDRAEYRISARLFTSKIIDKLEVVVAKDDEFREWNGEFEHDDEMQSDLNDYENQTLRTA